MSLRHYDAVLRDFEREFDKVMRDSLRHGRGYMAGNKHVPIERAERAGDCFIAPEDRPLPVVAGIFEPIPRPVDPYRQTNPISQDDEE